MGARLLAFLRGRFSASRLELLEAFGPDAEALRRALRQFTRSGQIRGYGSTFRVAGPTPSPVRSRPRSWSPAWG